MLDTMKQIINPNVVINYETDRQQLILEEKDAASKVKALYIGHIPHNALAFTLDYQPNKDKQKFKQLSLYVNAKNDNGVNKGCDLIILWQKNDKKGALILDLKSDRPKKEATQKQLDNSELFLKYLLSMASAHYGVSTDNIEINKAIVTTNTRNINKRVTYQGNKVNQRIGNYRVESVAVNSSRTAQISFRKLIN